MGILKNKNFLFLLIGRIITNIGDSIYYIAAMWLVYSLGGNAFYSGLAGFLTLLPVSLQFITGPFVDRWPVKRTLIITQVLQAILILIIPITYYFGVLTVQIVLIVMPIVAFIEQFAYPSQTKALPLILPKKDLLKGNSYFSFAYQGIDLVFNAVAGILVAVVGAVTLFLVDSVTFTVAAILFSLLKIPHTKEKTLNQEKGLKQGLKKYFFELKEGFSIVFGSLMATFLIGSIVANFAIGGAMAILPAFADHMGGSEIYGFYLAAMSTGALVGALLANQMGKFRIGPFVILSFLFSSICWVIASIVPWTFLGVLLFSIAWIPIGGTNVIFAATVQTVVPNHVLGRVNTVSASMGTIAMPIGSLAGGYFASVTNATLIFALTGLGLALLSIIWFLHPRLRSLPKAKDLDPKAFGLDFAEELVDQSN
ncbi:MFS transporter [Oceanobacillus chungangensis]|uniref:MFS transporter n=1 Tax=Oceanobacillus chungangensis TaxID=1229152 RepID=A0A3D8PG32_9BACI|nr:MFS transporter [Oceanobacillus chungangensis]RDW15034.1 MFS transporter [Oceanobacillus chungangensis]